MVTTTALPAESRLVMHAITHFDPLLYHVDTAKKTLTVLALYHAAQDRSRFLVK